MKALAIIPARGGSKGVPRKNVRQVGGRPLIAWSIEQALASDSIGSVIVSTDDDEIGDVSQRYGAEVFWRSAATATDTATTESAMLEVLERRDDCEPIAILLQATSPIRQPWDIGNVMAMLHECDSVFSSRIVHGYTWTQGEVLAPEYNERKPRQLLGDVTLEENGSIYGFWVAPFMTTGNRLFGVRKTYVMHPLDSFQVDCEADIELIESLMPLRMPHVGN